MFKAKDEILPGSDKFTSPEMSQHEKSEIEKDPATHLANHRGQFLEIYHIPSGQSIKFKAYIEDFQDKYDSEWNSTDVYGRMDPIHQYQGTKRNISLDWVVPAYSVAEAKLNHRKCGLLFSMLYPNYTESTGVSSATLISTAPLFKVKFGNLIQDPTTTEGGGSVEDSGLVGAISGFTYSPNIDAGFIDDQGTGTGFTGPALSYNQGFPGQLYPKEVKLSMEYTVFHTHALGWTGSEKREPRFPYGELTAAGQSQTSANQENLDEQNEAQDQQVLD
jgi:hypothetical protein